MESKLQQLTERLYQDGLSKGQSEAKSLIQKAEHEAAQIVDSANKQAQAILAEAQNKASELLRNTEAEVQLATRQTLTTVRQGVESLITLQAIDQNTHQAMDSVAFMQSMIQDLISRFNPADPTIQVILPAAKEQEFLAYLKAQAQQTLSQNPTYRFENKIKSGFRIVTQGGRYQITFTDADFAELFKSYSRSKLLLELFEKQN